MTGTLYIVGTPIGNLEDMTFRAVDTLKNTDLIAAEDTRGTVKLLNHFDIHTPMRAYHKFNEREETPKLIEKLMAGANIALVTDAGMPVISDPGQILVAACHEAGISVRVVPGPTAAVSAVALSGIDCKAFTFIGFLGKKNKDIADGLAKIAASPLPVVMYESPHRIAKMLDRMAENFPDRKISISREMTKRHEETLTGTVAEMAAHFEATPPKGEFVLVIDGADETDAPADDDKAALIAGPIEEHIKYYTAQGMREKDAMRAVAADRGISRREVYQAVKVK